MLKAEHRLRKQADIKAVYKAGTKLYHPLIRIFYKPSSQPSSRFAVVVAKIISKRAVDRNKIRRRIRAAIHEATSGLTKSHDIIFVAQPKALTATQADITQAATKLLAKHKFHGV